MRGVIVYLGNYATGTRPPESALGVFDDAEGRWHAHCWRESFGPFDSRAEAETDLTRICGDTLRVRADWLARAALAGRRLLAFAGLITLAEGLLVLVVRF